MFENNFRDLASHYAERCWVMFFDPQAYYWLRISFQNHARLARRNDA